MRVHSGPPLRVASIITDGPRKIILGAKIEKETDNQKS